MTSIDPMSSSPINERFTEVSMLKLSDEELIKLLRDILKHESKSSNKYHKNEEIIWADLYTNMEPWEIFKEHRKLGKSVVYFATKLKRKSLKNISSNRVSRRVGRSDGLWYGTTKVTPIKASSNVSVTGRSNSNCQIIGWKRSLRYTNKSNASQNCQWLMTEYNVNRESKPSDIVICKIKDKSRGKEERTQNFTVDQLMDQSSRAVDHSYQESCQSKSLMSSTSSTISVEHYHEEKQVTQRLDQAVPAVDYSTNDEQMAGMLMEDWGADDVAKLMCELDETDAELTFNLDEFLAQLEEHLEGDLDQSSEYITMLPGPDPYTQNHLLC